MDNYDIIDDELMLEQDYRDIERLDRAILDPNMPQEPFIIEATLFDYS